MSKKENDIRFIKRGKLLILAFGLLSLVNIIILIGRNSSYALFRRNVQSKRIIEIHTAKEFPSKIGVDVLEKKLGEGGLVGIPTDCSEESCEAITDKNADKSTIREYRYSGEEVNNYVYFNCKEGVEQNATNCETWRIIGIFKDEAGQEHIKIVKNEELSASEIPDTYEAFGKTFAEKGYWNNDGSDYDNNWEDAGLMHWLNSTGTANGYLKILTSEAQDMIYEMTWNLGNVSIYSDTTIQAYEEERKSIKCSSNDYNSNERNCYVWPNNQATWNGKIALIYPSDWGFSSDSSNWSTKLLNADYISIRDSSWLYKDANLINYEWLLSPSSRDYTSVTGLSNGGSGHNNLASYARAVRPTLYLKSTVQIIDGNGSSEKPYKLNYRAVDVLKEKLGTGGLVGIPTSCSEDNCTSIIDKTIDKSTIREYRYSGLNVNNYVTFNEETWRIIGVFKDENGKEHLKIVRNEVLKREVFPITYTVNETSFDIQYNDNSYNRAYFNSTLTGTNYNDWTTAGLMYWLNSKGTDSNDVGYLKTLTSTAQNMIYEATWYLGNHKYNEDTTVTGYTSERDASNIYSGNKATWEGKIGLMYPSDFGFSADSSYWNSTKLYDYKTIAANTSWLQKKANRTDAEWFLPPSSGCNYCVANSNSDGLVRGNTAYYDLGVRPSLYIQSQVRIKGGTGEENDPYQLFLESK